MASSIAAPSAVSSLRDAQKRGIASAPENSVPALWPGSSSATAWPESGRLPRCLAGPESSGEFRIAVPQSKLLVLDQKSTYWSAASGCDLRIDEMNRIADGSIKALDRRERSAPACPVEGTQHPSQFRLSGVPQGVLSHENAAHMATLPAQRAVRYQRKLVSAMDAGSGSRTIFDEIDVELERIHYASIRERHFVVAGS